MIFFKNKIIYITKNTKLKNKIGQIIEGYIKDRAIKCNIQPIDEKSFKYTWGEDVKSSYQLVTDEDIQVNKILVYNDKAYKIEKKIDWTTYKIYALLEVDVEVLDEESK
ncbi:hypothetical protein NE398_07735 [Clostridium tertium]|uniref:Phage head-tail joining protein n=1 Tax=Clostridium tertium TaxID=1559 RepID=A0A9X4B0U3_9CLOT|nr:hypothetical protein [Clostridium tertium]MDC4240052.1 hypothetical protein [Clostridium tertium]